MTSPVFSLGVTLCPLTYQQTNRKSCLPKLSGLSSNPDLQVLDSRLVWECRGTKKVKQKVGWRLFAQRMIMQNINFWSWQMVEFDQEKQTIHTKTP